MFELGYENWEPEYKIIVAGEPVVMSKEQFRKNVLIKIDHCDQYFDFEGNMKFEAKSISYAKLGQKGFEDVYNRCLHFIGEELLRCGKDELHDMVMMHF